MQRENAWSEIFNLWWISLHVCFVLHVCWYGLSEKWRRIFITLRQPVSVLFSVYPQTKNENDNSRIFMQKKSRGVLYKRTYFNLNVWESKDCSHPNFPNILSVPRFFNLLPGVWNQEDNLFPALIYYLSNVWLSMSVKARKRLTKFVNRKAFDTNKWYQWNS